MAKSLSVRLLLGSLVLAACSSPSDPVVVLAVTDVRVDTSGGSNDTESRPDTYTADVPGSTGGGFCESAAPACEGGGGFNCPCSGNADCLSGICLQTAEGKVCSEECVECCPLGFSCEVLAGSCPDCRLACIPTALNLCRPCKTNAECENPFAPSGERCVNQGALGSFCGVRCGDNEPCPAGYECEDASTVDGSTSRQCVPSAGMCQCSAFAAEQGAETACSNVNELGSCPGTRVCTAGGLSACSGSTPAVEECDGLDNDCDGLKDEGTCPGDETCACNDQGCACGCPPGLIDCGGGCVDGLTSVLHCGGCNKPCTGDNASAFVCSGGECKVAKCAPGFEDVDGKAETGCECVVGTEVCNGKDDDCDGEIDEGSTLCAGTGGCTGLCTEGACSCDAGCGACGGVCVPEASFGSDPKNCGYCGNACDLLGTAISTCEQGACCAAVCKSGYKDCNKDCTDGCEWPVVAETCDGIDNDCNGQTDELPLADCGGANKVCQGGNCICDPTNTNLALCGGTACIDLASDADHCGICGNDCDGLGLPNAAVTKCVAKECGVAVCKAPWVDVDGLAFNGCECQKTSVAETCNGLDDNCNGLTDEQPLAGCGGAKICDGGQCVCDPSVANLAQCAGDSCVDLASDPGHCGFCGNDCGANGWPNVQVTGCVGKACTVAVCKSGYVDVDGQTFNGCECQKTASAETCDGVDNDCDGVIDTFSEACSTQCGAGTRSCSGGVWTECTAQKPLQCTDYATCQATPVCAASCPPVPAEQCNGADDNCNFKVDEGFQCTPGEKGTQACGNCGSQPTVCNSACTFEAAGPCTPGGICTPGEVNEASCGLCGKQSRTCSAQCQWSAFSGCSSEGSCAPSSSDTSSCGKCGKQVRLCSDQCQWGLPGSCTNEGVCAPSETSAQPCGLCGTQTRACTGQCTWGGYGSCQNEGVCTPGEIQTEPCGNCGTRTRSCTAGCQWGGWSGCTGQGVCSPKNKESQSCGSCGTQERTCSDTCAWGNYGTCTAQGACTPGAEESQACGNCGTQKRVCSASCGWGAWQTCSGQGVCAPGTSQAQACGNCGSQSRVCTNSCAWGAYSACGGQGTCVGGTVQTQACGNCGTQTRTCSTTTCGWGSYGTCTGQGACAPNVSSACTDGCGTRTCAGSCAWGACNFTLDGYEPNENYTSAKLLGSFDEGDSMPIVSAWLHQDEPALASPGDVDRYYMYLYETDLFDTNLAATASLSASSGWHSLCIFFDRGCNGSVDTQKCSTGYGALAVSTGDIDNVGSDDDGCMDIEVFGDWSCASYTLQFGWD